MNHSPIIYTKIIMAWCLIGAGIIFVALGGFGILTFIPTTIEINGIARLANTSPGVVLVIFGYLLIKNIHVIEMDDNKIILGYRKK